MGTPVKIDDVARHLIELSGEEIEISYTGLRAGEKLHEDLFTEGEPDRRPNHPLISQVEVPPVDKHTAGSLPIGPPRESLVLDLQDLCTRLSSRMGQLTSRR